MLEKFQEEIAGELKEILTFWLENAPDKTHGGFIGKMDSQGYVYPEAEKGGVLNARILWTFSAALRHYQQPGNEPETGFIDQLRAGTERAFDYFRKHFFDHEKGGVFWSVNADGSPGSTRKQIYALAFAVYALSEYSMATENQDALDMAVSLYRDMEKYSFDSESGGYLEAFSRDWELLEDLRLSEKDRNDPKTMNTHLHIIEAYVNLFRIWQDKELEKKIRDLLTVFEEKIIDRESFHLKLFFDRNWQSQSRAISFGHDIEASWLLYESAEVLDDKKQIEKWKTIALEIAEAATEGLNKDGSLNHEYDPSTGHWDTHREWWVPAEAMVGYLNAYELHPDEKYLEYIRSQWTFIQWHLKDSTNGEWIWGVYPPDETTGFAYRVMDTEDKIGFWKCPYHNGRACIEILKRIDRINNEIYQP